MKNILFILSIYLILSNVVYAEVSQFVFTNEQRSVLPNTISESLTIQSQNGSGTQESITETTDLFFQSSSPTGEFLNSSGNPVSTTMSKNTSNRTFYYRDGNTGTHTLSITATGRDTKKTFSASQIIFVGVVQNENTTSTTTNTTNKESSNTQVNNSSHSSPSPASDSKAVISFEVSSGRKRFSSVGSEVAFKAEPTKLSGVPENYIQYIWTFGDGTTKSGQVVSHRYKFSGDYVVVLNANYSDRSAVSRTDVTVIDPELELELVVGGVGIINNSDGEINLGEWSIEGARTKLDIPRDTIIQKGKKVTFPYNSVFTDIDVISLKNPLGVLVAEGVLKSIIEAQITESVPEEEKIIEKSVVKYVYIEKPIIKKEVLISEEITVPSEQADVEKNNLVATVYQASPKASALESFLWIPRKGWGLLTGLFK